MDRPKAFLSKSAWGQHPVEAISICTCEYVNGFAGCLEPLGQTKNDTDLKLGTYTPYLITGLLIFFEKVSVSLENMPCHLNFPHISSIALLLLDLFPNIVDGLLF